MLDREDKLLNEIDIPLPSISSDVICRHEWMQSKSTDLT